MSNLYTEINNNEMYAPLSNEENNAIALKAQGDESFRTEAINHNLRLVLKVANLFNHTPMGFDDRFQEGYKGLEYAITSFDPVKGTFGTYAHWCIRGYITNNLHKDGASIVMPTALRQRINKYRKFCNQYEATYGGVPNDSEVAEAMNLSMLQIERIRLAMSGVIISINAEVGDDAEVGNFISSEVNLEGDVNETQVLSGFTSDPSKIMRKNEQIALIGKAMEKLSEVERLVIKLRMNGMKLEKVSDTLRTVHHIDRTLQCVQQIEKRGYEKIRSMLENPMQKLK